MNALTFDFISDGPFRDSLISDYREMTICVESGSWKAVHVLAGSVVEALLIEYLVVSKLRPKGIDPHKIDLATAIEACVAEGVIKPSTASLCEVIRDYRNLIHPGRVIRLEREVTPEGAQIAVNLVSLIAKEVALRRKLNYGPTAEQILAKIETDEHSLAVLPELLSEAKEHELARLVATLIPDAYRSEEAGFTDQALLSRFRDLYRRALVLLPEAEQVRVAEKFALAVRQESAERIRAYSDAFFSAEDIKHLQAKDSAIVVKYLLNQLDQPTTSVTPELLKSMEGIGKYIESKSAQRFADTLIRLVLRPNKEKLQPIQKFVHAEYDNIADEASKKVMEERLAVWIKYQEGKPAAEAVSRLQRVADFWVDIPF